MSAVKFGWVKDGKANRWFVQDPEATLVVWQRPTGMYEWEVFLPEDPDVPKFYGTIQDLYEAFHRAEDHYPGSFPKRVVCQQCHGYCDETIAGTCPFKEDARSFVLSGVLPFILASEREKAMKALAILLRTAYGQGLTGEKYYPSSLSKSECFKLDDAR